MPFRNVHSGWQRTFVLSALWPADPNEVGQSDARIIDRLRKRLDGDVHDDPERESRILLDGALWTNPTTPPQYPIVRLSGTAVQQEQQLEFWQRQLKSKGYHLRYEIVDYPGGMPGDVGITLSWS
jgi:hypothetical protein